MFKVSFRTISLSLLLVLSTIILTLISWFVIISIDKLGFYYLFLYVLIVLDSLIQACYRKVSIKALLPFFQLYALPFFVLLLISTSKNALLFTSVIFSAVYLFRIVTTAAYLKNDFIFILTAPINLKHGLPFADFIFKNDLNWNYFFKRKLKPEIIQLLNQSIHYHEKLGLTVSIKLKNNLEKYNLHANINHQIEK